MKEKTIYLHIGVPKTGTTSIQNYLADNYENLYRDGFLVPLSSRLKKSNHTLLANYCLNNRIVTDMNIRNDITSIRELKKFKADFYENIRNEIRDFTGKGVILSNEQCYGHLTRKNEIKRLRNLFSGICGEMKVIVYVREQSELLCSLYSTRMKGGNKYKIPDRAEFAKMKIFDFSNRLKAWEEVFGIENILLRVYDKQKLLENDAVSDFCRTIGIPHYNSSAVVHNQSMNAKQCEFLRIVNGYIPLISRGKVIIKKKKLSKMVEGVQIDSPPVSALICSDYQQVFDESNRSLSKRYFGHEKDIFTKKRLGDKPLDQSKILTDEDKKQIASLIIESYKEDNAPLCRCISEIFNVQYDNAGEMTD